MAKLRAFAMNQSQALKCTVDSSGVSTQKCKLIGCLQRIVKWRLEI